MSMTLKDLRDAVQASMMTREAAVATLVTQSRKGTSAAKAAHALFGGAIHPQTTASRKAVAGRKAERKLLDQIAELRDADVRAISTDADLAR